MPTDHHVPEDFSRACWRCRHWGGLVARVHAKCTRLNSALEASPATGCAYWNAGPGNSMPAEWLPDGFTPREHRVLWGKTEPIADRPPLPPASDRPQRPADVFAYDQKLEANAWAEADALMARARHR